MPKSTSKATLTPPDLVVLALLSEGPMHGYELNRELVRREAADWAGISRAQVYYSLRKLDAAKLIRPLPDQGPELGPERVRYDVTRRGITEMQAALARPEWATQRKPPPFMTWLALSPYSNPAYFSEMLRRRRSYVIKQLEKEETTMAELIEAAPSPHDGVEYLLVKHAAESFKRELEWLELVHRVIVKRESWRRFRSR